MTAFTSPSKSTGRTMTLRGSAANRPEPTRVVSGGRSVIEHPALLHARTGR